MTTAAPKKVLRMQATLSKTALGRSTIYGLIKDKRFPAPIKLGRRAVGWLEDDIDRWLDARKSDSNAA